MVREQDLSLTGSEAVGPGPTGGGPWDRVIYRGHHRAEGGSGRLPNQQRSRKARSLRAWLPNSATAMIVSATMIAMLAITSPSTGWSIPIPAAVPSEVAPAIAGRQGTCSCPRGGGEEAVRRAGDTVISGQPPTGPSGETSRCPGFGQGCPWRPRRRVIGWCSGSRYRLWIAAYRSWPRIAVPMAPGGGAIPMTLSQAAATRVFRKVWVRSGSHRQVSVQVSTTSPLDLLR